MPYRDLKVLLDVIPALQAEESMVAVQRYGMGSGAMAESTQKQVIASWKELVGFKEPTPKRSSGKDMLEFARSMSKVKVVRG